MASRPERCSNCGVFLRVPPEAQTIRCGTCQCISTVRPNDPRWDRVPNAFDASRIQGPSSYPAYSVPGPYHYPNSGYFPPQGRPSYPAYSVPGPYHYPNPGYCPPPRPVPIPPSPYGKKRALLCGINYRGKPYGVKGSINDVNCMKNFLTEMLGYRSDSILMLTEDETVPYKIPTKQNIRGALRWLVQGCQSGDSLLFHYSGHAKFQRDYDGDEVDGFDEALCPLDHETEGLIIDDEINATIVRPLPRGVVLHAIIDACYSGTMLDLPFVCRMDREGYYEWEDHRNPNVYKGTNGGIALCLSACDDGENCGDTTAFTGTNARTGALTFSFIQAVQNEPGLTYGRLLTVMRSSIHETVSRAMYCPQEPQEPLLSSSEKFEIFSKKLVI